MAEANGLACVYYMPADNRIDAGGVRQPEILAKVTEAARVRAPTTIPTWCLESRNLEAHLTQTGSTNWVHSAADGSLHPPALMRFAPTPHLRAQDVYAGVFPRTEVRGWPQA